MLFRVRVREMRMPMLQVMTNKLKGACVLPAYLQSDHEVQIKEDGVL